MAMWLAVLEAQDGSWDDDPLPTDGDKEMAISNAKAMWPTISAGQRIALYSCTFVTEIDAGVFKNTGPLYPVD